MDVDKTSSAASVLVVDDSQTNRQLAQSTLEAEGFRVFLACDGAEAIEAFERHAPDCVLLDARMPRMDGFEACESIRRRHGGLQVPIIFVTAMRDLDTFDDALRAGADDFLTKPIRPAQLVLRVHAALKLRRLRSDLHEHYELLKKQRDDVVRLQLQKERLMAFVVHDLKNPVNAVDLEAQAVLRDAEIPEWVRESARHIRAEANQLLRMVTNLLDLSRADEGKLLPKCNSVDLPVLIASIFEELGPRAVQQEVSLETRLHALWIDADEGLLRRTLSNLIDNALRYAPARSAVTVTASPVPKGIELRVADQGPGISEASRQRVFDAFVQNDEDGSCRSSGGQGLGLAFCKLAIEAHGGEIWIEDGSPGAVFCVRLRSVNGSGNETGGRE
jgi:two-component system sensor histidine kinase/response regulator